MEGSKVMAVVRTTFMQILKVKGGGCSSDYLHADGEGSKVMERADYTSEEKIFACNHCTMKFSKLINLYKHLHTQVSFCSRSTQLVQLLFLFVLVSMHWTLPALTVCW